MCYFLMLSTLLPPINSNQQERMWAGQEIQSSLRSTCLSFIQNELRPMLGRALHGSEMQQLGEFLDVAEQWFPKTLQDRHVDTWHVAQSLWGCVWPPWCQRQRGYGVKNTYIYPSHPEMCRQEDIPLLTHVRVRADAWVYICGSSSRIGRTLVVNLLLTSC